MKIKSLLGLLFVLFPIPGLCLDTHPSMQLWTADAQESISASHFLTAANVDMLALNDPETPQLDMDDDRDKPDAEVYPHLNLPSEPNWDGLMHDSKLFLLYQVAVVGVIYMMPESTSQWSDEDKSGNIFRKWDDNVNNLRKDGDDWGINYIGHPYFGSVYYVRARSRGFDRPGSFWYAVTMSTIYEYGIEALFEPVSIQDLIFTPVGGAIIGEYFMRSRENVMRGIAEKGYADTSDKLALFFTDPLDSINKKVNKWIGYEDKQARLDLMPIFARSRQSESTLPSLLGLQASFRW